MLKSIEKSIGWSTGVNPVRSDERCFRKALKENLEPQGKAGGGIIEEKWERIEKRDSPE